ncbi:MAG: electron transporter RnfG, partial [Methylococcaceae bacterium]|nr:electron transporter RnfG [Methylococcaceae bacterium]
MQQVLRYVDLIIEHSAQLRRCLLSWLKQVLDPDNLQQLRPQLRYQTGILGGFALAAALLLGLVDLATRASIQLRLQEDLKASLADVVPAELYDNDLLLDTKRLINAE